MSIYGPDPLPSIRAAELAAVQKLGGYLAEQTMPRPAWTIAQDLGMSVLLVRRLLRDAERDGIVFRVGRAWALVPDDDERT